MSGMSFSPLWCPRRWRRPAWPAVLAALVTLVGAAPSAVAKNHLDAPEGASLVGGRGAELLLDGWAQFGDLWLLLDMIMVMALALALAAIIAYHPSTRRSVSSLEHHEQPKTFLLYAVVAAIVALIVTVQPAMAFVIFGIGGLLRFRTMVGEAKDTGRVILVTVVGLCCGLKIFIVAVPATLIGWLLIFFLERDNAGIIRISGVAENAMAEATRAYRAAIVAAGCTVLGEQTKFIRREFMFVVTTPIGLDRGELATRFDALPAELRGVVDFERI
jgi:hypothetical protein